MQVLCLEPCDEVRPEARRAGAPMQRLSPYVRGQRTASEDADADPCDRLRASSVCGRPEPQADGAQPLPPAGQVDNLAVAPEVRAAGPRVHVLVPSGPKH